MGWQDKLVLYVRRENSRVDDLLARSRKPDSEFWVKEGRPAAGRGVGLTPNYSDSLEVRDAQLEARLSVYYTSSTYEASEKGNGLESKEVQT